MWLSCCTALCGLKGVKVRVMIIGGVGCDPAPQAVSSRKKAGLENGQSTVSSHKVEIYELLESL